jgi:RNA polymerase sporulation-specific sigma factor
MKYVMNDYELIYLFQTYQDDLAFEFLVLKYRRFIWKIIHTLYLQDKEVDDFYQESILMLYKAAQTFREKYQKSFTKYFELILRRQLYYLKKKIPNVLLSEESFFKDFQAPIIIEEEPIKLDHPMEQKIFEMYYEKRMSVKMISNQEQLTAKQVYNLIYRVKKKIKEKQ